MVFSLFRRLWNGVSDTIEVFYLVVAVRVHRFLDYMQTIFRFYFNPRFRKADRLLVGAYFFSNPYRLSRRFLQQRGETDVYVYGETPLTTLELIAKRCQITAEDTVFELGMGRGRTCFWLKNFIGCRVVGIEYIPTFVDRARAVAQRTQTDGIEFRCENYLESDLTGVTVCYLYASNLDDAVIEKLVQRFLTLPKGTRFITVSFSLSEYSNTAAFKIVDQFPALFLWGRATVYLEIKR